jgi:hypothetical protein
MWSQRIKLVLLIIAIILIVIWTTKLIIAKVMVGRIPFDVGIDYGEYNGWLLTYSACLDYGTDLKDYRGKKFSTSEEIQGDTVKSPTIVSLKVDGKIICQYYSYGILGFEPGIQSMYSPSK